MRHYVTLMTDDCTTAHSRLKILIQILADSRCTDCVTSSRTTWLISCYASCFL